MQDLLATVASLQRELAMAQSALDVVISNFDIGHAMQLDVDMANLAVFQLEQSIETIHGQLWILSLMLTTPSMLLS
jgi:outer membrane protein TolC